MNLPTDAHFRQAYEVFDRDHVRRREELLEMLSAAPPEPPQRALAWRRRMWVPTGLAATLLGVALVATLFTLGRVPRVYGVEGLRDRLLSIDTLHIKGWIYQQTKTEVGMATIAFPTEEFYKRPYCRYHTSYGFSFGEADKLTQVTRAAVVGNDRQVMVLDHDRKRATITHSSKLDAELKVEIQLQGSFAERLLRGLPDGAQRVGAERIGAIECDIYEVPSGDDDVFPTRTRLWLNQMNGMPVRLLVSTIDPESGEVPWYECSEIRTNVDVPEETFAIQAPEGYETIVVAGGDQDHKVQPTGSGAAGKDWAGVWIGLNIDDRAVLLCWSQRTEGDDGPKWFEIEPTFNLVGAKKRSCSHIVLCADDDGETRWRWSLLVPQDRAPIGESTLRMVCKGPKGTNSQHVTPLVFAPARLKDLLLDVQKRTHGKGDRDDELWTLERIRQELARAE